MIIDKENKRYNHSEENSYISIKQLLKLLNKRNAYKEKLIKLFEIDETNIDIIQIGNSKDLLLKLLELDSDCEKYDIEIKIKNISLLKLMEKEKALFSVSHIKEENFLKKFKTDNIIVETRYLAKSELLDYYNLNKFANYCREQEYDDLIDQISKYLHQRNQSNKDSYLLRIVKTAQHDNYLLRAITSVNRYKDYGLNFSVFVILMTLNKLIKRKKKNIYISQYKVDESHLYVSFLFEELHIINNDLAIKFELTLENDEVKRKAVRFNGNFKVIYRNGTNDSSFTLKPDKYKNDNNNSTDLFTYNHSFKVETVMRKIEELPKLVEFYTMQIANDSQKILQIKSPNDVKRFLAFKIRASRSEEFQKYKEKVFNELMKVNTDNIFKLFNLFRNIDELFENEDILSRDYWRIKLYETLINKR